MNLSLITKALEIREKQPLADRKTISCRRRHSTNGDILLPRDPFEADAVKILNSKAFRRLSQKTQVTSFPINHHIRNRLTHSLEVSAIAVTIADALGLNASLARAIGYGHDIGHVPLGHPGEYFLAEHTKRKFTHEIMGVFVAQHIERKCMGLNLTHEVLEGMLRHSGQNAISEMSPEAHCCRHADKFAFIFSDFNDFKRFGVKFSAELICLMERFGDNQRERVATAVSALVVESAEKGRIEFKDSEYAKDFARLRELMYEIYPRITAQDPARIIEHIFNFVQASDIGDPLLVMALMTDTDIEYLNRQSMLNISHIRQTAAGELMDNLSELDCCEIDLAW